MNEIKITGKKFLDFFFLKNSRKKKINEKKPLKNQMEKSIEKPLKDRKTPRKTRRICSINDL